VTVRNLRHLPASCKSRRSEIAAIAAQYAHRTRRTADNQLHLRAEILRSSAMKQGGAGADQVVIDDPSHARYSFWTERIIGANERHRRFFTPGDSDAAPRRDGKHTDALLAELRRPAGRSWTGSASGLPWRWPQRLSA